MMLNFVRMDHCFRELDQKLSLIHREVRFIVRTLARLRHRHNAASLFSSKQLPHSMAVAVGLQDRLSEASFAMWEKLFRVREKSEPLLDVESAPATPTSERPPSWGSGVDDNCVGTSATARSSMTYFMHTPPSTPK